MFRLTRIVTPASRSLSSSSSNHTGAPSHSPVGVEPYAVDPSYPASYASPSPSPFPLAADDAPPAAVADKSSPSLSYFTHSPAYPSPYTQPPAAGPLGESARWSAVSTAPAASSAAPASASLRPGAGAPRSWRDPPGFSPRGPFSAPTLRSHDSDASASSRHTAAASSPTGSKQASAGWPAGGAVSGSPLLPGSVWEPLCRSSTIWGAEIVPTPTLSSRFRQNAPGIPWKQARQYALWGFGGDKEEAKASAAEEHEEATDADEGWEDEHDADEESDGGGGGGGGEAKKAPKLTPEQLEEQRVRQERHRLICTPRINLHDSSFEAIRDNLRAHIQSMDHAKRALPRVQRVNVLIKKVETEEQWREMVAILRDLLKREQEWDRHTLGSLIAAAQRTGREEEVVYMIRNPIAYRLWPTTGLLNKMAWKLFQVPNVNAAMSIFSLYPHRQCEPNKETYEMFLRGLAKNRALHLGMPVAEDAVKAQLIRDAPSWRRAVLVTLAAGAPTLAAEWCDSGALDAKFAKSANVATALVVCRLAYEGLEQTRPLFMESVEADGADKVSVLLANALETALPALAEDAPDGEEEAIPPLSDALTHEMATGGVSKSAELLEEVLPQCEAKKDEVQAHVERWRAHLERQNAAEAVRVAEQKRQERKAEKFARWLEKKAKAAAADAAEQRVTQSAVQSA